MTEVWLKVSASVYLDGFVQAFGDALSKRFTGFIPGFQDVAEARDSLGHFRVFNKRLQAVERSCQAHFVGPGKESNQGGCEKFMYRFVFTLHRLRQSFQKIRRRSRQTRAFGCKLYE